MPKPQFIKESVELDIDAGELVPGIFQLPRADNPVPAALLLHGFSSRKERMADSIGRALAKRGVASFAIDLPLHGTRDGSFENLSLRNPMALVGKWRLAIREARAAIHWLAEHPAVDPRRLALGGYSLGAYLSVIVASEDPLVRAVALAAGGDLPEQTPFASLVRAVADPRRAARRLDGRPLFMINGKYDRTIRPEQARTLFDAAEEPKEIHWYDGGHWPPVAAIDAVAEWVADRLDASVSTKSLPVTRVG
ncbi:MAG TPA: alpha/beta fold hydrolase [Gemmatimonadaceae bacterium]|nr:alpha/beta fold hydrolase [Gemmatimonadaceae bacterium]